MLLAYLQETVVKRPKAVEELQKLLDISDCSGVTAKTADTVEVISDSVVLQKLVTPGRLPFKVLPRSKSFDLKLFLPTVTSYEGSGLEQCNVKSLTIGRVPKKHASTVGPAVTLMNKLRDLKGLPTAHSIVFLYNVPELKSFEGLKAQGCDVTIEDASEVESLKGLEGVKTLVLRGDCKRLTFQHFPKTVESLDLELFEMQVGVPWYVTIPASCRILNPSSAEKGSHFYNLDAVPLDLQHKIIKMQEDGKGSRIDMLQVQADLIDAECPDKLTDF